MDFGLAETGIARGSPPGTTTEVLRFGVPFAEIRVVSLLVQPTGNSKESCKWRRKIYLKARSIHS
jgi:hypothetical protein